MRTRSVGLKFKPFTFNAVPPPAALGLRNKDVMAGRAMATKETAFEVRPSVTFETANVALNGLAS